MNTIRVLIVDDHAIVRTGISIFLESDPTIEIVGEAEDGREALRQAQCLNPDVILMDLVMPGGDGLEAIVQIKQFCPDIKIIVLTSFDDVERVTGAIKAGADGYLLKDADGQVLIQAVASVRKGGMPLHPAITSYLVRDVTQTKRSDHTPLTERETEILQLVTAGLSNRGIGQELGLTEQTVKGYVSTILSKLNMSSRTEAAVWAVQSCLVSPEGQSLP